MRKTPQDMNRATANLLALISESHVGLDRMSMEEFRGLLSRWFTEPVEVTDLATQIDTLAPNYQGSQYFVLGLMLGLCLTDA